MFLKNYGFDKLAKTIAKKFINTVNAKFKQTGKICEKYDVINSEQKASKETCSPRWFWLD
ncbi:MAG: trehalase family glycosidase [Francisella endosymbiont of Hyalomma scupense]